MAELKPCPFCGGSVSIAKSGDNGHMWWFVTRGRREDRCRCRVFMESEEYQLNAPLADRLNLKNDLIEAWNRRVNDG